MDFERAYNGYLALNKEKIVLIGDLNGRIGNFSTGKRLENERLREDRKTKDLVCNGNGEKIIKMMSDLNMEVINGRTESDQGGEVTFISKGGKSVIDLCLATKETLQNIYDLKVGTGVWSDHQPIELSLVMEPIEIIGKERIPSKIRVSEREVRGFRERLARRMKDIRWETEMDIEKLVEEVGNAVTERYKSVAPKTKNKGWFNDKCEESRKKVKNAYEVFKREEAEETRISFVNARKEYTKVKVEEKTKYFGEVAKELNEARDGAEFWKIVNVLKGEGKANNVWVKAEEFAKRFSKELGNRKDLEGIEIGGGVNPELDQEISKKELEEAIKYMKNRKSPGMDRVTAEVYKAMPKEAIAVMLKIFNRHWKEGSVSRSFKNSMIYPIYKKGCKKDPGSYRGISLLNIIGKIYTKIIQKRMQKYLEDKKLINEFQAGYREGYSTVDHIYTLNGLIECSKRRSIKLYTFFINLSSAFDMVNREKLIGLVKETFKSDRVTAMIKELYNGTSARVWNGEKLSEEFITRTGVRQVCCLSALLFNLYMNKLPERLKGVIKI